LETIKEAFSMDKISSIAGKSHIPAQKPVEKSDGELFKKALDKATAGNETVGPQPAQAAPGPGALGEIMATSFTNVEYPDSGVAEKTDRLLGLLDTYAKELSDPGKTLKDIEPLISDINESARLLSAEAGENDPRLAGIARETAMTAAKEYAKFNRGDYV
jgi:hypothetical protein